MKHKLSVILLFITLTLTISCNAFAAGYNPPKIYGKTGITVDLNTGEIIYSKNIDKRMFPASTTKLLTALILTEHKGKNDILKYTEDAKKQPSASLNLNVHPLNVGDTFTAEQALDGLLVYSANDIAYVIADNVAGSPEGFADLMKKEIDKLNLKNTNYITPNGLHNPNHYTTAYDLSVISKTAFSNPWIKQTLSQKEVSFKDEKGRLFNLKNTNKNLGINGCIGGKTGYTNPAGRCLVAFYERNGRQILGIVMGSVYDSKDSFVFNDMNKIIDWSYNTERTPIYKKDSIIKIVKLNYKPLLFFGPTKQISVPLTASQDISYYENPVNKKENKITIDTSKLKIDNLQSGATLTLKERNCIKTYKLYSNITKSQIIKDNLLLYIGIILGTVLVIALIILLIIKIKNRPNRRRKSNTLRYYR